MVRRPPISTLPAPRFPYTTLFRSASLALLQQIIRNGRPSDAKVSSADRLGGLAQVPDLCARKVMQERRQETSHAKRAALDGGLHTTGVVESAWCAGNRISPPTVFDEQTWCA